MEPYRYTKMIVFGKDQWNEYYDKNGKLHRLDGPAMESMPWDNIKRNRYYIHGNKYPELDYLNEIKNSYPVFFPKVFADIIGTK